jgi:hypothetical protein
MFKICTYIHTYIHIHIYIYTNSYIDIHISNLDFTFDVEEKNNRNLYIKHIYTYT